MDKTRQKYTPRTVKQHMKKVGRSLNKVERLKKLQAQTSELISLEEETLVQLTTKTLGIFEEVRRSCAVDLRECAICLDEFGLDDTELSFGSCSHLFHHICLSEWQKEHKTCPCCGRDRTDAYKVSAYDFLIGKTLCEFVKEEQDNFE